MANVNISYDQLTSAANAVNTHHGNIGDSLRQIKATVDALVTDGFVTDTASKNFHETYTQFDQSAQTVINNLPIIAQYLNNAVTQFQTLDANLGAGAAG